MDIVCRLKKNCFISDLLTDIEIDQGLEYLLNLLI